MVPEAPGRALDWAAAEWAEVAAGRDRARAVEEREPAAPAEAVGRVRAEDCGNRARVAGRVRAAGRVAARVRVADREAEEADPEDRAEVAGELARAEVGERELDRVGVGAPGAGALVADLVEAEEERVRVWAEGVSAAAQVRVEVAEVLVEVERVLEVGAEEELGRAERERRENG